MKRYIIAIFLECCATYAFSQDQYAPLPIMSNVNERFIDSIMNQYANNNYKALIYSPPAELSSICFILIIDSQDSIKYWAFRDDMVSKQGVLPDNTIFKYKDMKKTGVIKKEQPPVKFTPPFMCHMDDHSEWVMYISRHIKFYFEYGKYGAVTYYAEDPVRKRYRKEWLDIIKTELKDIIFDKSN